MISFLLPTALAALPSLSEPLRTGNSAPQDAAVVIGLEDYAFLPDIPYARADAQVFADWLVYTRGVPADRVRLLTAGSVEDMRSAVAEAREMAGSNGTVWVYYAGHGAASTTDRRLMLLGDDAKATASSFLARGVTAEDLGEIATAGGRAFMVIDACQSGTSPDGKSLIPGTRLAIPVEEFAVPGELTLWTSTSPGQLANPYPPARHGAFTYFAVGALRGWADGELGGSPDGVVTVEEAKIYVDRSLRGVQVDQQPALLGKADPERTVVLRSKRLESGPAATELTKIGEPVRVSTPTAASPSTPVPGGPTSSAAGLHGPLTHVAGSTWSDANGTPLSWHDVKRLATDSPEGTVAVRRLRWGWAAPAAVTVLATSGFFVGKEAWSDGVSSRTTYLEGAHWETDNGLAGMVGGMSLMVGCVTAEVGVLTWRVVRTPRIRLDIREAAEGEIR